MRISDWSSDVCSSDLAGISSVPHDQSYPRQMKCITHYLEFPSREAIDATLHEATLPTLDTYRQAVSILREICSWTLTAPAKPEDCSAQISNLTLDAIPVDELPYAHLRPGHVLSSEEARVGR